MKSAQTIEAESSTLEQARQKINAKLLSDDIIVAEQILSDGEFHLITATADSAEEAFVLAEKQVPDGAAILEKGEKSPPSRKIIEVEAVDENTAKAKVNALFTDPVVIKSLHLTVSGQKGFLGMGAKPNKYEIDVLQQSVIELGYKTKAKISCDIRKRGELKRSLKSDDENEILNAAIILLKSNDRVDRMEAASSLKDKKQGLLPLFDTVWEKDNPELHAISDIFWRSLWHVARLKGDRLPPMQAELAKIDDPIEQLSYFSSSMAKLFGGAPSMARAQNSFSSDSNFQIGGFRIIVEGLVKDFVLDGRDLGPGHKERVQMIMDQIYNPTTSSESGSSCKAFQSGRCVSGQRDTGACTWNPNKWESCNVVIENRKLGTW